MHRLNACVVYHSILAGVVLSCNAPSHSACIYVLLQAPSEPGPVHLPSGTMVIGQTFQYVYELMRVTENQSIDK